MLLITDRASKVDQLCHQPNIERAHMVISHRPTKPKELQSDTRQVEALHSAMHICENNVHCKLVAQLR